MFEGTLDRDIRFTPEQITATRKALRTRRAQLGRSIAAAEAAHRAGQRIQHNTHDRNVAELAAVCGVIEALDVAEKQIQHRIREKLGLNA